LQVPVDGEGKKNYHTNVSGTKKIIEKKGDSGMSARKKSAALLSGVFLLALLLLPACGDPGPGLSVVGGEPVLYGCGEDRVTARYYSLSDESLRFVKILFPDGREYTLPQAVSASGARYTDDMELLWWVKGDSAYVEMRDAQGEWKVLYQECRVIP
jgi:membrane-bound inhibitor of C-type lysozyme